MTDLQIKVRFDSICINGTNAPGLATPVESFILSNSEFFLDSNGNFFSEISVTAGDQYRYLIDSDGYKWRYSEDGNGFMIKENIGLVGGQRTYWIMLNIDSVVSLVGADTNGGFETYFLQ